MSEPTLVELIEAFESAGSWATGDAYDPGERIRRRIRLLDRLAELDVVRVSYCGWVYHGIRKQLIVYPCKPAPRASDIDAEWARGTWPTKEAGR